MKFLLMLTLSIAAIASNTEARAERAALRADAPDESAPALIIPAETHLFAHRDTCDLYLDIYEPAKGSETTFQGIQKPVLVFVYGGGFIIGNRREVWYHPWLKQLIDAGYKVVAIDYRLGLKGVDMRFDPIHIFESSRLTKKAVDMGVEDVFSAVKFLVDERGFDPSNFVVMGNSAGAMISLSAEWEACNADSGADGKIPGGLAEGLPNGFHFKGVMSFAGAIMTLSGKPKYKITPAPQLLVHGDRDGAVTFKKVALGKYGLYGSSSLVKDIFAKKGYVYHFYRYAGHSHDMAGNMEYMMQEQFRFLEEEVMLRRGRCIDITVNDPEMHVGQEINVKNIYN